MRFPVALVFAVLLASPAFAATVATPAGKPATAPAKGNFPLSRATPEEVRAWLGEPVVANEEGKGAFWTYRLEDCALMVFFKDEGQGLRVSGVATGPRRRADTAPDADACITNARK